MLREHCIVHRPSAVLVQQISTSAATARGNNVTRTASREAISREVCSSRDAPSVACPVGMLPLARRVEAFKSMGTKVVTLRLPDWVTGAPLCDGGEVYMVDMARQ